MFAFRGLGSGDFGFGGFDLQAHSLVYHSTLGLRATKNKKQQQLIRTPKSNGLISETDCVVGVRCLVFGVRRLEFAVYCLAVGI